MISGQRLLDLNSFVKLPKFKRSILEGVKTIYYILTSEKEERILPAQMVKKQGSFGSAMEGHF